MILLSGDIKAVFWIAVIPALISVAILIFAVNEPKTLTTVSNTRIHLIDLKNIGSRYWSVVLVASIFSAARFSEAFLILRAQQAGLELYLIPLIMVAMNLVYAFSAYPAGSLSDRIDRRIVLAIGLAILIIADVIFATANSLLLVFVAVMLWGLHLGLTQGLFAAMIADLAPPGLRGSAFGIFNLLTGLAILLGNLLAGLLWDQFNYSATFMVGAAIATLALISLLLLQKRTNLQ